MIRYAIYNRPRGEMFYGLNEYTLLFNTAEEAERVAEQLFDSNGQYLIIKLKLKD